MTWQALVIALLTGSLVVAMYSAQRNYLKLLVTVDALIRIREGARDPDALAEVALAEVGRERG
jgi:hypothetical protein